MVVYYLLDTYSTDEVFADTDTNLLDMEMTETFKQTTLVTTPMKSSLRIGVVHPKAHLFPRLVSRLP